MVISRRNLGRLAFVSLPGAKMFGAMGAPTTINSKIAGVQIGAQTYSFRTMPEVEDVIKAMVRIGLGEAELMSEHAEAVAGAPPQPARDRSGPPSPEQREAMRAAMQAHAEEMKKWRASLSMDKFKGVRKRFDDAGINIALVTYNMNERTPDDEIEYAFQMARVLGVQAITTSTQVSMAKRIAPFADKHQMLVGFHGHDATDKPDEVSTPETFAAVMSASKYHRVNLDIGHFVAAGYDPVAYIKEHHDKITNLHLKDRKKNHGANLPWGEGDTPIKEVLQLVAKEKYGFPCNIEFEYRVPEGSDVITEVGKCFKYCKDALA